MKRFHVNITVEDLDKSIGFYSQLFGQAPSKQHEDYAKWMLEDPRVNFAISTRSGTTGVDHFGIQVDTQEELAEIRQRADLASGGNVFGEGEVTCCYAEGNKHWTTDPQGLAWEHFQTLSDAPIYGDSKTRDGSACCVPDEATEKSSSCCG